MRFSFLIIDDNDRTIKETLDVFENFPNFFCAGIVKDSQTAIKEIIKNKPQLVLVQTSSRSIDINFLFDIIKESFQYLHSIPYFIALAKTPDYAFTAIQSGFSDYILMPLKVHQLGKSLFQFERRSPLPNVSTICINNQIIPFSLSYRDNVEAIIRKINL